MKATLVCAMLAFGAVAPVAMADTSATAPAAQKVDAFSIVFSGGG